MREPLLTIKIGELYSNEEIFVSLGVGNTGGVRVKLNVDGTVRRVVIFTTLSTPKQIIENPYADRLEGDTLIFTGTGKTGEQTVSGFNARICEQPEAKFPIYVFTQIANRRNTTVGVKRWCFLGLLSYIRCYQEQQPCIHGEIRRVWIFEFKLLPRVDIVSVANDIDLSKGIIASLPVENDDDRSVVTNVKSDIINNNYDFAAEETRTKLLTYDPKQFEIFIGELLRNSGFKDIQVTRYSQDGGIDINARLGLHGWPLRHLLTQIQAKRWRHTVGRREIADLRGSLQPFAAGCIVTTSHFSKAALFEATESGKNPITTIDGFELAKIVNSVNEIRI